MEKTQTHILLQKDMVQSIAAIVSFCKQNNASMACWRLPHAPVTHLMIDFNGYEVYNDQPLEDKQPGFILSPFQDVDQRIYLSNDLLISWGDEVRIDTFESSKANELLAYINQFDHVKEPMSCSFQPNSWDDGDNYKELVRKSVDCIKGGYFSKVVPSRNNVLKGNFKQTAGHFFKRLATTYPNAFVSVTYTSKTGLWAGATPELLLSTSANRFQTVALAGTQVFNDNKKLSEVAWTQKEIEEQAIVSRYIINCFKKIRLREFSEHGPKTVKAGNLIHLKTEFEVDMAETNFSELGSTMLKLLHPTSAVCGMPLESSKNFLLKNEGYDRELFSGYLGPVNIQSATHIYVNLRCMQVCDNQITLYAGAGVTEDSVPEKEWLETEMKMQTMLNVISPQ